MTLENIVMDSMLQVHIDIETKSEADLSKVGVYNYGDDPTTDVWCVCFQVESAGAVNEINVWVPGQPLPAIFTGAMPYIGIAHNASFERVLFEKVLGPRYGFAMPERWICTMAMAAHNCLPLGLDNVAAALGLETRKDSEGANLMRQMCDLTKKRQPGFDDLERLVEYCKQDVRVEHEVFQRLEITDYEQAVYEADQRINDRGIAIDRVTVASVIKTIDIETERLENEFRELTQGRVDRPGQVVLFRDWLHLLGVHASDLTAETVDRLLDESMLPEPKRALEIRQLTSQSSLKKFPAMLESVSDDGRARGLFLYCGAMAAGRWTSRRIQIQNLPRLALNDDEVLAAVEMFREGGSDVLRLFIGDPLDVAKQMLRPVLMADVVGDWASIELRVSAWLSGQADLLQELRRGDDVYKSMASVIYGLPLAEVTKDQRQIGKIAVLGCGYSMGWRAFYKTLEKYRIIADEKLAERAVSAYRMKNAEIANMWSTLNTAAINAINEGVPQRVGRYLRIGYRDGRMSMQLPSGRVLRYYNVRIDEDGLSCANFDHTRNGGRKKLYGGLLFENACQGVARDILAATLLRAEEMGLCVVSHTHDEIAVEGTQDVDAVRKCMETLPEWAEGLPIKAEVFSCAGANGRYTK
jgi:DNA polymerase